MILVFKGVVSNTNNLYRCRELLLMLNDFCCKLYLSQIQSLIAQVGVTVVDSIRKDYGANADVTGLWNTTMDLVGKICCTGNLDIIFLLCFIC